MDADVGGPAFRRAAMGPTVRGRGGRGTRPEAGQWGRRRRAHKAAGYCSDSALSNLRVGRRGTNNQSGVGFQQPRRSAGQTGRMPGESVGGSAGRGVGQIACVSDSASEEEDGSDSEHSGDSEEYSE
ncbi:hypothetical protein KFL_013450020, partial [Klebsormidium nitens]